MKKINLRLICQYHIKVYLAAHIVCTNFVVVMIVININFGRTGSIFIQFYDHNTRIFEELSIEPYKYGYLTFLNSKINGKVPRLGIGLNKECGIKRDDR